jgi:hypothetical protein
MAMPGDDEGRRTPQHAGPDPFTTAILADQRRARARIQALDRQHRISSELEQLAPLTRFYGPRPLRAVPLAQFLAEGWWAA